MNPSHNGVVPPSQRIPLKCPNKWCRRPLLWGANLEPERLGCVLCKNFFLFAWLLPKLDLLKLRSGNAGQVMQYVNSLIKDA